jgi:O-antigen/teichoic acid export membrane protein
MLGVSYAPGFLVPFVAHKALHLEVADRFLLVLSAAVTTSAVISQTLESIWSASVVRGRNAGVLSRRVIGGGMVQASLYGVLITLALLPVIILTYAHGHFELSDLAPLALLMAPYPILAAACSVLGGLAIASGRLRVNLLSQSLRSLGILCFLGFGVQGHVWPAAIALSMGEAARLFVLTATVGRRLSRHSDETSTPLPHWRELMSVGSSQLIVAIVPVLDRAFLVSFPSGTITDFEMADRIFFAANQVLVTTLVLARVSAWRLNSLSGFPFIRAEIMRVIRISIGLTAAGIVVLIVLLPFVGELPITSTRAIVWAAILCLGLPFAAALVMVSRLATVERFSGLLPMLSICSVAMNLIGNWIGSRALGPVGVVLATPTARLATFAFCLIWLTARFRSMRRAARDSDGVNEIVTPA